MRASSRILGTFLIIGAAAGGLLLVREIDASARDAQHAEARRLAGDAQRSAQDAIAVQLEQMKARASGAAALSQVRALSSPADPASGSGHPDELAATLRDSFQTETWWQPFRDEFQ